LPVLTLPSPRALPVEAAPGIDQVFAEHYGATISPIRHVSLSSEFVIIPSHLESSWRCRRRFKLARLPCHHAANLMLRTKRFFNNRRLRK
jgi:hypothetical protein